MIKSFFSSAIKILGLLALVALVLVAIIELSPELVKSSQPASPNNAYPPPANTPTITLTPTPLGYPPPQYTQQTQSCPRRFHANANV